MPEFDISLAHWLYWSALLILPAILAYAARRAGKSESQPLSLPLGYFFLLTGGFIGLHRLYIGSRVAAVFIVAFLVLLSVNVEETKARNEAASINISIKSQEYLLLQVEATSEPDENQARVAAISSAQQRRQQFLEARDDYHYLAGIIGYLILLLIGVDCLLLPRVLARRRAIEGTKALPPPLSEDAHEKQIDPAVTELSSFERAIGSVNNIAGEFCCYWTLIAVFVLSFEVLARYVLNSPTNWAHESMFLMFGMQYLLVGGYCLREKAHVRVDLLYSRLAPRQQAMIDVGTSVFFFIFALSLGVSGWIFFSDSFTVGEVSFTEWEVSYWPVKMTLPLGAALLLLQGLSQLMANLRLLREPSV